MGCVCVCFICSGAPFSAQKHTQPTIPLFSLTNHQLCNSLQWLIYVINSVDKTTLPCYTLPPTQHHNKLTPLFAEEFNLTLKIVPVHKYMHTPAVIPHSSLRRRSESSIATGSGERWD